MYCEDCTTFTKRFISTSMIRFMLFIGYFGNVPLFGRLPKRVAKRAKDRSGVIKALPYEEMVRFVENAEKGYVFFSSAEPRKCRCRSANLHRDKETDLTCVDYGHIVEIAPLIKNGGIRLLYREEVLEIIREAKEKNMVHTVTTYRHHDMYSVCSCCGCCCIGIVPYRHGIDDACESSGKIAVTDEGSCTGCGACVRHCDARFGARRLIEKDGTMIAEATERCVGCGTCRFVCPNDCITLSG
jgi:hypothetical protein